MMDQRFEKRLRQELNAALKERSVFERDVANLFFGLGGTPGLSPIEISKVLGAETGAVIKAVADLYRLLQRKELIHALPRRAR